MNNGIYQQLTFWSEEPPARRSASPESEAASPTTGETCVSPSAAWRTISSPSGCCGKTFPESFPRRIMRLDASWALFAELTPPSSLQGEGGSTPIAVWWPDQKEPWRGGCLTPNGTEYPSEENVCLSWLWQALETGPVPTRFYLSANACRGILRRAERRGKKLPEMLEAALRARIGMGDGSTPPCSPTSQESA